MLRPSLLAAILLALTPAHAAAKEAEAVQFLDRSVITVPKAAGRFTLRHAETFPQSVLSGVSTAWSAADGPSDLTLNLFVYPLGEGDETKMTEAQASEVEAELKAVAEKGTYTDLEFGPRMPFLVVRRDSSMGADKKKPRAFDPTPKKESTAEPSSEADPLLGAIADSTLPENNHGIRESIRFKREGVPVRSMAYVFNRHLFGFKIRVSVAESSMDQAAFEALADEAARWLVPQVEVMSYGTCGNIEIATPAKGSKKDDAAMALQLIRGTMRVQNDNCAVSEGKKERVPDDVQQLELVYAADTWKQN